MAPLGEPMIISGEESARRYRFLHNAVIAVIAVALIEFVFLIVLSWQMSSVGDSADKAEESSNSVHEQVSEVLDTQVNSPQAQEAARQIRQRIINIEYAVCNGPCPDAPVKAPNPQP